MNIETLRSLAFEYPQFLVGAIMIFVARKYLFRHGLGRDLASFGCVLAGLLVSVVSYFAGLAWLGFLFGFNMKGMRGVLERSQRGFSVLSALSAVLFVVGSQVPEIGISWVLAGQAVAAAIARAVMFFRYRRIQSEKRFFTGQLREQILERDGYRCVVPGCNETTELQIDHIKPYSKGGETTLGNGQTLCRSHNASKGAKSELAWKMTRRF